MSVRFCLATTIAHGSPTLANMTSFDDPAVKDLSDRIEIIPDANVPTLSCALAIHTQDGSSVEHYQSMKDRDFSLSRAAASELVRSVGEEMAVDSAAYDWLERFVDGLPAGNIRELIDAFGLSSPNHIQKRNATNRS